MDSRRVVGVDAVFKVENACNYYFFEPRGCALIGAPLSRNLWTIWRPSNAEETRKSRKAKRMKKREKIYFMLCTFSCLCSVT